MEVALRRADVSEGDSRAGSFFLSLSLRTDEGGRNVKRAGANERRRHATGEQKKKGWRNFGKLCVAVSTNAYALENTLGGGQQWTQGERRRACSGRPVKTCGAQHEAPSHFGMDSATSLRVRMGQARGLFRRPDICPNWKARKEEGHTGRDIRKGRGPSPPALSRWSSLE